MKNFTQKIALLIVFIILYSSALAQKMNQLDSLLVKVDQSLVTSGIIYERVTPMADLYAFNYAGTEHNIADYGFFKQALSEMYRASNPAPQSLLTLRLIYSLLRKVFDFEALFNTSNL